MSKKGNKQRAADKRRQKRALKQTQRRKSIKPKPRKKTDGPSMAEFSEEDRSYWLAHGVNFLTSNYGEGVWNPLFPEIYEDKPLTEDVMSARLLKIAENGEENMTGPERAVFGYAFQTPQTHYAFKLRAEQVLKAAGEPKESARLAHQPLVWQMFHDEIMVNAMKRAGEEVG